MYNIAVFVSGRGSNLKAILNTIPNSIKIAAVISDKLDCAAFDIADQYKITKYSVLDKFKSGYLRYEELLKIFLNLEIDLIVLAGFLKKIPDIIIDQYVGSIINIHPALLPSFGGKGMYGMNVHKAVVENKEIESGITIHFVNEKYDDGELIFQATCPVVESDTPEMVAQKIHELEFKHFPAVIEKVLQSS